MTDLSGGRKTQIGSAAEIRDSADPSMADPVFLNHHPGRRLLLRKSP